MPIVVMGAEPAVLAEEEQGLTPCEQGACEVKVRPEGEAQEPALRTRQRKARAAET